MKPSEIYNAPVVSTGFDICSIESHIGEISVHELDDEAIEKQKRIEIRNHVDYCCDGRRTFTIASVWFMDMTSLKHEPVMIVRSAGREGRDARDEFIINQPLYIAMVQYLLTFVVKEEFEGRIFEPDEDIEDLDKFYGRPVALEMFGKLNDRKSWLFHLFRELVRRRNFQSQGPHGTLSPTPIVERLYETIKELQELDPDNGIYHKIKVRLDVCGVDFPKEKIDEFYEQIDGVML